MNKEVENELKKSRVGFVHFVDISKLTNKQNRGLPCAILIGIAINPKFVKDVFNNPDYKPVLEDEYVKTENRVGEVTDELAEFLVSKGYKALSQSDAGLLAEYIPGLYVKGVQDILDNLLFHHVNAEGIDFPPFPDHFQKYFRDTAGGPLDVCVRFLHLVMTQHIVADAASGKNHTVALLLADVNDIHGLSYQLPCI